MVDPLFVSWLDRVLEKWVDIGAIARADVLRQLYDIPLNVELADKLNRANRILMLCEHPEEQSY